MKMPPPIATKFTKLVLTILAITILGIILSFVSQDHTLLMLSAGVAVAGGVKIIDYYDEAFYQDNSIFKGMPEPEHDYGDLWYNHACDITLSEMSAGVMPYGVVSSSGFGDGSYVCHTHKGSDGEIDFAFVIFIDE